MKIIQNLKKSFPEKVRIRYPETSNKTNKCFAMTKSLTISSEGDVYTCPEVACHLFKNRLCYGNVFEDKISNIWHGKKYFKLFKSLNPKKEKCICCPIDKQFNVLCAKYY